MEADTVAKSVAVTEAVVTIVTTGTAEAQATEEVDTPAMATVEEAAHTVEATARKLQVATVVAHSLLPQQQQQLPLPNLPPPLQQ